MKKLIKDTLQDLYPALLLLALMWLVFLTNVVVPYDLNNWGIYPEKKEGLWGIIFSPVLHGSWAHLLSNSVPVFVLTYLLYRFYRSIALSTIVISWIMVGVLVWITGLSGVHIGMSGVIYALASFLFFSGLIRKYKPLIGISFFIAFMYGSLIWGILPLKEGVSWQSHLWGGVIGFILAIYYRKKGPKEPKYQYEIEEEMGIEPEMPVEVRSIAEERAKIQEEQQKNTIHTDENQQVKIRYRVIPKKKDKD